MQHQRRPPSHHTSRDPHRTSMLVGGAMFCTALICITIIVHDVGINANSTPILMPLVGFITTMGLAIVILVKMDNVGKKVLEGNEVTVRAEEKADTAAAVAVETKKQVEAIAHKVNGDPDSLPSTRSELRKLIAEAVEDVCRMIAERHPYPLQRQEQRNESNPQLPSDRIDQEPGD